MAHSMMSVITCSILDTVYHSQLIFHNSTVHHFVNHILHIFGILVMVFPCLDIRALYILSCYDLLRRIKMQLKSA